MQALEGIRILDWTAWQQGPVATAMLGDLGAEVIKIEDRVRADPGRGMITLLGAALGFKGRNFYFETNNRNKKSITVDLQKEKGKEIVYRLAKKSDVFVHNYRQRAAKKLGLTYEILSKYNPKLIYATGSGFGPKGSESDDPCMDIIGQARSGIMYASAEPELPPQRWRGAIADQVGAMGLAYGVLAALMARERNGVGQEVHTSLLGSLVQLQGLNVAQVLFMGKEQAQQKRTKTGNPLSNFYQCQDCKSIALSLVQSDRYWPDFCRILGIKELEKDPRFENATVRAQNCEQLITILDRVFATKPRSEWLAAMRKSDFIVGPINTASDLVDDPQVIENEYISDFKHPVFGPIKVVGFPVTLSKTPCTIQRESPEFGQHTEEVLLDVGGYTWEEIAQLRDEEII